MILLSEVQINELDFASPPHPYLFRFQEEFQMILGIERSDKYWLVLRYGNWLGLSAQNSEGDRPHSQGEPKCDETVCQGDQQGGCHIDA